MPKTPQPKKPLTLCHEPDAVVYAREKAGLSMTAAAELITKAGAKTSLQLLNDIEKGRRNATPIRLQRMAQVYGCPVVVLERKRWAA